MYLNSRIIAEIFPHSTGIKNINIFFHTVASKGEDNQPHGLFIPLWNNFNDLLPAINRGALAAVWDEQVPIPAYTPNHFPIYLTKDIWKDTCKVLELYLKKLEQEDEFNDMANILFLKHHHTKGKTTNYNNEDRMKSLFKLSKTYHELRRGKDA